MVRRVSRPDSNPEFARRAGKPQVVRRNNGQADAPGCTHHDI
jgi:hypothetical protein